jgi:hypothetical protein
MSRKNTNALVKAISIEANIPEAYGIDDKPDGPIIESPESPNEWDGYMENNKNPKLCFYLRVSKRTPNHSNHVNQMKALILLYKYFEVNQYYPDNNDKEEFLFSTIMVYESDFDKTGTKINSGLETFLDQLYFDDIIIVKDISRLTRMNVTSVEFKYLHRKLYEQDRLVYMLGPHNTPIRINKSQFLQLAKYSNDEFEVLKNNSIKGNAIKSATKRESMDLCKILYEKDFSHKLIAKFIGKKVPTVKGYIAALRKKGVLTRYGRSQIAKRTRPAGCVF